MSSLAENAKASRDSAKPPAPHATRHRHTLILLGALLIPALGATMFLEPNGRVSLPGLRGRPLPTLCVSRRFGWECATCGLTRSIIALLHGDWPQSLRQHRFGWLIALVILGQIPYRAYRLARPDTPRPAIESCGLVLLVLTMLLVVGNWLCGLAMGL